MATEVGPASGMSQYQSVQKVMALPTVEAAVGQVGAFYNKVKGDNALYYSFSSIFIVCEICRIGFICWRLREREILA